MEQGFRQQRGLELAEGHQGDLLHESDHDSTRDQPRRGGDLSGVASDGCCESSGSVVLVVEVADLLEESQEGNMPSVSGSEAR